MGSGYILTIAIPTYNRRKTLETTLKSVLSQITDDVELLVSDNASTDDTKEYMKNVLKKYPYVKFFRNNVNLGSDENFRLCMERASGKFVLILSDDDYFLDNGVNNILNVIKSNKNLSLIFLNSKGVVPSEDNPYSLTESRISEKANIITDNKNVLLKLVQSALLFISTTVYNKSLYECIDNPKKFVGTSFWHTYVSFCVTSLDSTYNIYVCAKPCIAARLIPQEINLSYSVYDVFVEKARKLFDYAVLLGYDQKVAYEVYYNTINSLVKWLIVNSKLHNKKVVLKHPWKIFRYTYKNYNTWKNVYPVVLLPRKALQKYYK